MKPMPAARWSALLTGVSITVLVLLVAACILVLTTVPAGPWRLAAVAPVLAIAAAALCVVRDYAVDGDTLRVRRLLWTTTIHLGTLQSATSDPGAGARSLRLLGNGGLFVFCGWFRNRQLGRYRAWVTDWQRAVVLKGSALTVVISPRDPVGFVQALRSTHAPRPARKPARRHVL